MTSRYKNHLPALIASGQRQEEAEMLAVKWHYRFRIEPPRPETLR